MLQTDSCYRIHRISCVESDYIVYYPRFHHIPCDRSGLVGSLTYTVELHFFLSLLEGLSTSASRRSCRFMTSYRSAASSLNNRLDGLRILNPLLVDVIIKTNKEDQIKSYEMFIDRRFSKALIRLSQYAVSSLFNNDSRRLRFGRAYPVSHIFFAVYCICSCRI
jgi:hypothetical protein